MSWPFKLRAASLLITIGVVLVESTMGSILIAAPLWLFDVASARSLALVFGAITAVTVALIALPPHVRPTPIARRTWLVR